MRQVTSLLIIFLLLNVPVFIASAESFSINESILDTKLDRSPLFSKIKPNNILHIFQKKIYPFFIYGAGDGFWDFSFSPEDIELKDDAYHRGDSTNFSHFTEWWYFDATFDNGYSAQMTFRVLSLLDQDIAVFSRLDLYKDAALISHKQKMHFLEDFYASSEVPHVLLNGSEIINGYINRLTGAWIYDISFDMGNTSAYLHFVGCTNGYKGSTLGGKWAVILPRAEVAGKLIIDGEEIKVKGIGYHDHNWEVTAEAALNFGWYWGKINSDTFTIVWADILATWYWGRPLLIISENNGSYQNVEQDDIQFTVGDFRLTNWMIVPHSFSIVVQTDNVSLDVNMKTLDIHYDPIMSSIINYWRYHMKCTGFITVGSQKEIIDDIIIAEFFRFRPY